MAILQYFNYKGAMDGEARKVGDRWFFLKTFSDNRLLDTIIHEKKMRKSYKLVFPVILFISTCHVLQLHFFRFSLTSVQK